MIIRVQGPVLSSPRVEPSSASFGFKVGLALARIRAFTFPVGRICRKFCIITPHAVLNCSISLPQWYRIGLLPLIRPHVMHSCRASSSADVSCSAEPSCLFRTKPSVEATCSGALLAKNTVPVLWAYFISPSPNSPASCREEMGLTMLSRAWALGLTSLSKGTRKRRNER